MTITELIMGILNNVAIIGIAAYLATRIPAIRRTVLHSRYTQKDKLLLGMLFGAFSMLGNYMSIPVFGALANHRIAGAVAGGLLGGRMVGVCAGILGAIPRYYMGGYTAEAAVLSNVVVGYVSGWIGERWGAGNIDWKRAMGATILGEAILKTMILTMSKPFEVAWQLESLIAIPTTLANSFAVVLFVGIIRDVFNEQEKAQALSAQKSLRMIRQASDLLQNGLNSESASAVARVILRETGAAAVAVTDADRVLAFVGEGSDHHVAGEPIVTAVTRQVLRERQTVVVSDRRSIGCPYPHCPLSAVIDAPLIVGNELLGTVKLYKINAESVSLFETELIQGIADFFSLLLARQKLEAQQRLLLQTEYGRLKAQVNPHFFFNTLGTIQALVQTEPQVASALIKDMAGFFRRILKRGGEFIPLGEELETVRNYLRIEQARFGDRIRVVWQVPEEMLTHPVPTFSLQPLVENAVRHGLSLKKGGGEIRILVWREDAALLIRVEDDGVGMSAEKVREVMETDDCVRSAGAGIGLVNVRQRIRKVYGETFGLVLESQWERGTVVTLRLPWQRLREGVL
ncbi:MAG TPA: LytS/YhcK type 5TM receptor domain-containing protein [Patescibacteria group bacterium]|nr:LytS/YhcK type 5TM receptor domain-containing protein [Patescibacteria group bacterium]